MNDTQEEMSCEEEGCRGVIDINTPVLLQTGCSSATNAFPCGECGRLHIGGSPVTNRQGSPAYWTGTSVRLGKKGESTKG